MAEIDHKAHNAASKALKISLMVGEEKMLSVDEVVAINYRLQQIQIAAETVNSMMRVAKQRYLQSIKGN